MGRKLCPDAGGLEPPDDPMRILKQQGQVINQAITMLEPPDDPMRILKQKLVSNKFESCAFLNPPTIR